MKLENLKTLKRAELQKLAKKHGVKANMKNEDIISAVSTILNNSALTEKTSDATSDNYVDDQENIDASMDVGNKRKRGRRQITKKMELKSTSDSEHSNMDMSLKNLPKSQIDLLKMTPPWESDSFNSSPEQDIGDKERQGSSTSPIKKTTGELNERRTRSSSRNRTPQSNSSPTQPAAQKGTFSVGKSRVLPRVPTQLKTNSDNKQKKLKRRSTTCDDEVIQTKRAKPNDADIQQEEEKEEIDEDLQRKILDEIRKKVDEADEKAGAKPTEGAFSSQIPRFRATGVQIGNTKPVTPGNKDWNKLHHKKFEQLESIDDYERRKRERAEKLLGSNQKNMVAISRLAKPTRRGPKIAKPVSRGRPKPSFLSPVGQQRARPKLHTPLSSSKPVKSALKNTDVKNKLESTKVFVPTVTSTRKMNLDFAKKTSKLATPKRVTIVSDQSEKKSNVVGTPAGPKRTPGTPAGPKGTPAAATGNKRKSLVTPYKGNTSATPNSKKNVFDLKESLKKPMSWVPHKGPLRPFNDPAKKPSFQDRMKQLKQPATAKSRLQRREKMAAEKKNAKDKRMLQRRGIK